MIRFLLVCVFFNSLQIHSQDRKAIDSINKLYVQGLNIPPDSIVALFKKNAQNAKKINYELGAADAYSQLSLVFGYQGKYEESAKNVIKAITIYEKLGLQNRIADYYAGMGYAMKYNDLEKAMYYMQKGKAVAEANGFENELKDIYNNYGVLKEINHELDSALFYYGRGLEIKQKLNDTIGFPYSWSNMAGAYGLKGNYAKARELFKKSLQKRLQWNDSLGIAENHTQLGEVFMAEKKWKEAIPYMHKSLRISLKKEYSNLTQYNYKMLSDIYKKLNNADSALYYFEQYSAVKDNAHSIEVQESIAALNIEYETERKENQILLQRAELAEKDLQVRRKNTLLFGSFGLAFLLGLLGYLFYSRQKLKTRQLEKESELKAALAKIEAQNQLQEQRLRISRDLHDTIGAQLTFIISTIDNIKYGYSEIGEKLSAKLGQISAFTTQTIFELRDTIWAMNKNHISLEDLQARISNFIENAKSATEKTKFHFEIGESVNTAMLFSSVQGMNIYRIIQEAVNNALKYAGASEIKVQIAAGRKAIHISISDNGKGFDFDSIEAGNGLNNMKKRAHEIKAEIDLKSVPGGGTTVQLRLAQKKAINL